MKKSNILFIIDEIVKLIVALPSIGVYIFYPIPNVLGIIYMNCPYLIDVIMLELN